MVSYIEKLFPFLEEGELIKTTDESLYLQDIFCPLAFDVPSSSTPNNLSYSMKTFQAVRVQPVNITLINENESVVRKIVQGYYGNRINLNVVEYDYSDVAARVSTDDDKAYLPINAGHAVQDIATDVLINLSANGIAADSTVLSDISITPIQGNVNLNTWLSDQSNVLESADLFGDLLSDVESSNKNPTIETSIEGRDAVYKWMDSYFALPEGQAATSGGREVVPLLIGPTGVFKSSTVKELCKKYDYRLVDFRVAFTSRLDYSGLFQMGEVDGKKYSYSCPMEEIVTCSDGFREYCRRAHTKVKEILDSGVFQEVSASDGEETQAQTKPISEEQQANLEEVLKKYEEYMKTPVLFFDEITRCKDAGVEGLLTEMLNQKRFNNMTMSGCKFVAATNLNLTSRTNSRHNDHMEDLNRLYDVNEEIDIAYANRFLPLRVQPEDVEDRWFSWAEKEKAPNRQNIHPLVLEFLKGSGSNMVYNDTPVLEAIEAGLLDNEIKSQSYPNYRTWDMVSDYLYKVDRDRERNDPNGSPIFKSRVIEGLISTWGADTFNNFLKSKGYKLVDDSAQDPDEMATFIDDALDAGVPALMISPSSLGKTSRVKQYIKKQKERTGSEPVLINIDLASKDVVDLMGMPTKISILDYVAGDLSSLPTVSRELRDIIKDVTEDQSYGITDMLTVRAPDRTIKNQLKKAKEEGREVVFMIDECNRVKNTSVLSAMFEIVSDYRFAGVDFSDMKDRIKVVAACNMAHSEMDTFQDYGSTGDIDPALAARFSIFWKKHYDKKDVASWINFMRQEQKEGKIDGILLKYFESIDPDRAVEIISSVEKRTLAYAQPSTRNLHQLSMDIKSMRGKSSSSDSNLFYGKILFDTQTRTKFADVVDMSTSSNSTAVDVSNAVISLVRSVVPNRNAWESVVRNQTINFNGRTLQAVDIIDNLAKCSDELSKMVLQPMTPASTTKLQAINRLALSLLNAVSELDSETSRERKNIFESYVGEEFANEFLPFFDDTFGSQDDVEITIEMLSDTSLVEPFFKRYRSLRTSLTEEQYEDAVLPLLDEFLQVHGTSLTPDVYAAFISGIYDSFASPDSMERFLKKVTVSSDKLFVEAEKVGDSWILKMLSATGVSQFDIDSMRKTIQARTKQPKARKRKSVVL